jgi:hypothetical protein
MISKYASTIFLAVMLVVITAVGALVIEPEEAGAANTTKVRACAGGTLELTAAEKEDAGFTQQDPL